MEYFSQPFDINLLKNHILKDPIIDWYNIISTKLDGFQKDKKSSYRDLILKESSQYKSNLIENIKEISKLQIETVNSVNDTKKLIREKSPIIIYPKLIYRNMNVKCDIMIRLDYFKTIFPFADNVALDFNSDKYILIDISYSTVNFKSDKKECLNEGILLYKKCSLYAFQLALEEEINYYARSFIIGKEYYYKKTRLPKKEYISEVIYTTKIKEKLEESYHWIILLKNNYMNMSIYPSPTHPELYPNMNNKESEWENEKYKLAERIKEITLVWNISYNDRCIFLKKGIKCWDDPKLLSELKDNKKKDIQERIIHMNQQEDILLYPRKTISKDFKELLIKKDTDIIFDVESFLSFDDKSDYFHDNINNNPILAIIGFIHNEHFYDYTISNYTRESEEKIIKDFSNHLLKISNKYKNTINIYHWGHAEYNYFNYIRKNYPLIDFPEYKLINILDYFRMEPIIVQGIFKFGLKTIGKALYKNNLIKTTWENDNDNGLDAMIQFKDLCIKNTKNIPIKRYVEISNIIEYNRIDCQVLKEIIELLRVNY